MIPTNQLHYWAGVFDFAGSIRWRMSYRRKPTPTICLGSKNHAALVKARAIFGGGIRNKGKYFQWETTGTNAVRVIRELYPYLRVPIDDRLLLWKASKRGPIAKSRLPGARQVYLMDER